MSTVAQLPLGGVAPKGSLVETNLAGRLRLATDERAWVKGLLIGATLAFLALVLFLPLVAIFAEALRRGLAVYFASFTDANALSAIKLTLLVSVICVPLNTVFGLAAAWAIGKFQFPGKSVLITLIDLPFAVSPVISGLIFVLLFGLRGWFGPWLDAHHLQIIFATPGVVLATIFVTFPFVAREVIPLMQEQGTDEELAAVSLGASGWQTFWRVTLNVVSGHVRGSTNTLPLHVEILYNEYNFAAAFAVASLLALLAVVTLAAKSAVEWRVRREFEQALEPARAEE